VADCLNDPLEVLAFLTNCATEHLAGRPDGVPALILQGAEGVDSPYGCCPRMLVVESLGPFDRGPNVGPGIITGCDPCDLVLTNSFRVTVKDCAPAFDGKSINGAPPVDTVRNALALMLVEEAWLLIQALRCCINDAGMCRCGNVTIANHSLTEGCAQYWAEVVWEFLPCC